MGDQSTEQVVIVGGGISGLSTAYYLLQHAQKSGCRVHCTVLEAAATFGGKIKTERVGNSLIEGGPESFVTRKPWAYELCRELGLADRLLAADDTGRNYVLHHGTPEPVPTRPQGFLKTPLLSWPGKLRAAREWWLPARTSTEDESLGNLVRRRFGDEVLENLVGPAVGSIYLSDVDHLSTLVSFDRFLKLEQTHGSLLKGMLAMQKAARQAKKATGKGEAVAAPSTKPPPFVTLPNGLGEWVETLIQRLREMGCQLRTQADVTQIEPRPAGGYQLHLGHAETVQADVVVLAVPAFAMAHLIAAHDAASADQLRAVRYVSVATVIFAFPRDAVTKPFDGFGVVVPEREGLAVLACEVMSNKWPARSPQDMVLLRAFLGGHRNEGIVAQPNEVLIPQAQHALTGIFGLQGQPIWSRVYRWQPGNPQYPVGHLAALAQTEARLQRTLPHVFLTGAGMRGLGLPDCVRQARDTATQVSAALLRINKPVLEVQS